VFLLLLLVVVMNRVVAGTTFEVRPTIANCYYCYDEQVRKQMSLKANIEQKNEANVFLLFFSCECV